MPKRRKSRTKEPKRPVKKNKGGEKEQEEDKKHLAPPEAPEDTPSSSDYDVEEATVPDFVNNSELFNHYYLEHDLVETVFPCANEKAEQAHEEYCQLVENLNPTQIQTFEDEQDCREDLILPILCNVLGHGEHFHQDRMLLKMLCGSGSKIGGKPDFILTKKAKRGETPKKPELLEDLLVLVEAKRMGTNFDTDKSGRSPAEQMRQYVLVNNVQFGIITDGRVWRLYVQQGHRGLKTLEYYQVRLPLEERVMTFEEFKWFYYFFSRSSFDPHPIKKSFIERVIDTKRHYVAEATTFVKENGRNALGKLKAIMDTAIEDSLVNRKWNRAGRNETTHECASNYLIRIMYILMAEGKKILPSRNLLYQRKYSLTNLIRLIRREQIGRGKPVNHVWRRLCRTFAFVRNPPPDFAGVPAHNLDLFRDHPTWEGDAMTYLGREKQNTMIKQFLMTIGRWKCGLIDFRPFSPRDIGDLYQILLAVSDDSLKLGRKQQMEDCSFYTPHWTVSRMVTSVLEPIVQRITEEHPDDYIDRLFQLKILDPAMGSGHFLVEAVIQLAGLIVDMRNRDFDTESQTFEDFDPEEIPEVSCRERIAANCIYGIDINGIAVDLAKCAVILACGSGASSLVSSRALEHHLLHGDSIVGCLSFGDLMVTPLQNMNLPGGKSLDKFVGEEFENGRHESIEMLAFSRMQIRKSPKTMKPKKGFSLEAVERGLCEQGDITHSVGKHGLYDGPYRLAVHWMLRFSHLVDLEDIWNPPHFDAVITNPPWSIMKGKGNTTHATQAYKKALSELTRQSGMYRILSKGTSNLYIPFLERCVSVLHPGHGCIAFLVQASVLSAMDISTSNSLFSEMLKGLQINSIMEFPKKSIWKDSKLGVNKPCIMFVAEASAGADDQFDYYRPPKSQIATHLRKGIETKKLKAWFNPAGFLIKNVDYPERIPSRILHLLNVYLGPVEQYPEDVVPYSDFCVIVAGPEVSKAKCKGWTAKRTIANTQPVLFGAEIHPFGRHTQRDATHWIPSRRTYTGNMRIISRAIVDFHAERRFLAGVAVDTRDGEYVIANNNSRVHDFSDISITRTIPGFTSEQITWIFLCFMNSLFLEFLFRSFEYTDSIAAFKVGMLPVPALHLATPAEKHPEWEDLLAVFQSTEVMLSDDVILKKAKLTFQNENKNERMWCLLACLALIGENLHTLRGKKKKNAENVMNYLIRALYGLNIDDSEYIDRYFKFITNLDFIQMDGPSRKEESEKGTNFVMWAK